MLQKLKQQRSQFLRFFGKLRKIPLTFDHVQYFQETFYHERMLQDQRKSKVKLNGSHKQEKTWKRTKMYASALAHNNEAKHGKYLK
jgi:aminoglycoside phosphotransferase (APT) family kinase protein